MSIQFQLSKFVHLLISLVLKRPKNDKRNLRNSKKLRKMSKRNNKMTQKKKLKPKRGRRQQYLKKQSLSSNLKQKAVPVEAAIKAHLSPGPKKLKYKRLP